MSERPDERPTKREAFLAFLQEGWVSVHLDARRPGVRVPPHLRTEPRLVLQYGRDMPVPIADLDVSEAGIRATLSFARTPHDTLVPWSAVYIIACTDGRGVLYQEDIPEELLTLVQPVEAEAGPAGSVETTEGTAPQTPPARALRSVPMEEVPAQNAAAEGEGDADPAPDKKPRRRKPTLRLIK